MRDSDDIHTIICCPDGAGTGVRHAGVTEDPEGCRGVCEVDENCTVRKTPFFGATFEMRNDQFTKTGSGQAFRQKVEGG
jgi:hypothetical protein|eukprot:COSAG06_NODE_4981_length_3810_cov_2.264619_2_plen_79_part_00